MHVGGEVGTGFRCSSTHKWEVKLTYSIMFDPVYLAYAYAVSNPYLTYSLLFNLGYLVYAYAVSESYLVVEDAITVGQTENCIFSLCSRIHENHHHHHLGHSR